MRILLLVQEYFPQPQSCAKAMHDLAVAFREEGHEAIVVAPDPALDSGLRVDTEDGLTVVRVHAGSLHGVPRTARAVNEWLLSPLIWRRARGFFGDRPCDLIVCYSPTIFFGPLVRRLKKLWRCPAYLVLRDIFPKWTVDAGLLRPQGPVYRFFRHYELLLYDAVDIIGVQSERNRDYFLDEDLAGRHRLEVLYNWAPSRGQKVAPTRLREELGLADHLVVLYGGNLGIAQDLDGLLRLAGRLRHHREIAFLLVGEGSEAARLAEKASRQGLDNVYFHGSVDRATYLGMVSESDIGLIRLRRELKTHNFPGKLLDYLYFGKPILASINPGNDLQQVLEGHEAGLINETGDDDRFCEQLLRLAEDAELRRRLGGRGLKLLEEMFSPRRAARQILAHAAPPSV